MRGETSLRGGKPRDSWRPSVFDDALFASVAGIARHLDSLPAWPGLAELNRLAEARGLVNAAGRPVRFVEQTARHGQSDYEAGILATGQVPTRAENWHDLLNALVWLAFPRSKAALNAVQSHALANGVAGRRPPLSDAATLFDESGLVLVARDDEIAGLLRAHRWGEAFWTRRAAWREIRCHVFGHAVLEKALAPFPTMTAKCLVVRADPLPPPDAPPSPEADAAIAGLWLDGVIGRPADLFPLPVLGIPGLWPANRAASFYADTGIFRPERASLRLLKSANPDASADLPS